MSWNYTQPVNITYGPGSLERLPELIQALGGNRGLLVAGNHLLNNDQGEKILALSQIKDIFSGISENPRLREVDRLATVLREKRVDFVIAAGGGSVLDCAKAAALLAANDGEIEPYFYGTKKFQRPGLPLIAIPTTAGTGSEVTSVSVLTDDEVHKKHPLADNLLYAAYALVDPALTVSMPPHVTAQTGIDALCHAIEAYWSIRHQPVTDALAIAAARKIFEYLPVAYAAPENAAARTEMSEASLLAGLAFNLAKTTGCHACSFPLTNTYGIPHGEACALTLDYFMRLNLAGEAEPRLQALAHTLGYDSCEVLADHIFSLKGQLGLRRDIADLALTEAQLWTLAQHSQHPNLQNNPKQVSTGELFAMYQALAVPTE